MKELIEILIYNIKKYRKQKNYSQEKLAELCNKSLSFIGGLENKRKIPSLKTLYILAKALEVDTYQLLVPEKLQAKNYYEDIFLKVKGKIDPALFSLIEGFLKGLE